MKFYYVDGSPNCQKVMAVINHLNISIEIEYLDFFNGDLNTTEYLAVNPNGKVPSITDGDFSLWESNAIMQYLADNAAPNTLFPVDSKKRADINRWQFWEISHYNKAFSSLAYESVLKAWMKNGAPDQEVIEREKKNLTIYAGVLEKHLTSRSHIVGKEMTLADYSLVHLEKFKEKIPFDWSSYPNINAYYARICSLPHWLETTHISPEKNTVNV